MLVDKVNEKGEDLGMKINIKKTKALVVSKKTNTPVCNTNVNGLNVKQENNFVYLGSTVTSDGRCEKEIVKRISMAKGAFNKMRNILINTHINIRIRKRAVKIYIWPVMLYGCETWTISGKIERKIEAAEMWIWRRMLKVSWTAKMKNEEVLERVNTGREIIGTIRKRQLGFLGHVLRRDGLENVCMTGRIDGRRARGRQRQKFMDRILEKLGNGWTAGRVFQLARDRKGWQTMIANVYDTALR